MGRFRRTAQRVEERSGDAREQAQSVRRFYEDFGWTKADGASDEYRDTARFVDTRAAAADYYEAAFERIARPIAARSGGLLLDAGSGAVPGDLTMQLSDGYDRRVCVDIAFAALREARSRLGDRGAYVQADICNLPFRDDAFSTAMSAHVIYHVPRSLQLQAFGELLRSTRTGGTVAVVHSVPSTPITTVASFVSRVSRRVRRRSVEADVAPPLYYDPLPYREFAMSFGRDNDVEITVYRLLPGYLIKRVPDTPSGRFALRVVTMFEDTLPRLALRVAKYQLVVARPGRART